MHDINSFRCQRQPMYGWDLVQTILSLSRQERSSAGGPSLGVWQWAGFLACQRVQMGVRPEDGGAGSLLLSHALLSYQRRAEVMEGTIRRSFSPSHLHTLTPSHPHTLPLQVLHNGPSGDISPHLPALPPPSSLPPQERERDDRETNSPLLTSSLSPAHCVHRHITPVP